MNSTHLNRSIWNDTRSLFRPPKGRYSDIQPSPSILLTLPGPSIDLIQKYENTKVIVSDLDTFTLCQTLVQEGFDVMGLNMASPVTPCLGDPLYNTQEEDLFRRSNFFQCIDYKLYPLKDDQYIYNSKVTVIKNAEYELCDPFTIAMITIAAIEKPKLYNSRFVRPQDYQLTYSKIEAMFTTAYNYGHDAMVLGAFGCGAFSNPPPIIAGMFKELIKKYDGCFKVISFGIRNDTGRRRINNYEIFNNIISNK